MAEDLIAGRLPGTGMEDMCPYTGECAHSNYGSGFVCKDSDEFRDCCTYHQFSGEKEQLSQSLSGFLEEFEDGDSSLTAID